MTPNSRLSLTSWNRNTACIIGYFLRKSPSDRWIYLLKDLWCEALIFTSCLSQQTEQTRLPDDLRGLDTHVTNPSDDWLLHILINARTIRILSSFYVVMCRTSLHIFFSVSILAFNTTLTDMRKPMVTWESWRWNHGDFTICLTVWLSIHKNHYSSRLHVLCGGNLVVNSGYPWQRANNAEI